MTQLFSALSSSFISSEFCQPQHCTSSTCQPNDNTFLLTNYFTFLYTANTNDSERTPLLNSAGLGNLLNNLNHISHPASTTRDHDACASRCACQYNCPITNTLIEKIHTGLQQAPNMSQNMQQRAHSETWPYLEWENIAH